MNVALFVARLRICEFISQFANFHSSRLSDLHFALANLISTHRDANGSRVLRFAASVHLVRVIVSTLKNSRIRNCSSAALTRTSFSSRLNIPSGHRRPSRSRGLVRACHLICAAHTFFVPFELFTSLLRTFEPRRLAFPIWDCESGAQVEITASSWARQLHGAGTFFASSNRIG